MFIKRHNVYLLAIVLFAFAIRIYQINLVPPSLNWDEVSHGYNAYSILKTGRDEWGNLFPIIFRAYGDYKLPVYIYLTAVSELFLGLSALAVRLPSVLAGTLSVLFTYLLVDKLLKNRKAALLSALFVTVAPWSLFLSRAALEANVALALAISGVYFLYRGVFEKNNNVVIGSLLLGMSVWTYNSARIFTPLILLAFLVIFRSKILVFVKNKRHQAVYSIFIFAVLLIPMFLQLLTTQGSARYENVKLLDEGAISQINQQRQNSSLPPSINHTIYNKVTYLVVNVGKNYLSYFSPNFLYVNGGTNYQFSVPNHSLLYFVNLPFLLLGLWQIAKKRNKEGIFLLYWFLLAPIPASITREAPHVLRSIFVLPIPMILTSIGVLYAYKRLKGNTWLLVIYFVFLLISFADYYNVYRTTYRDNYSWSWQYGYEDVANYIKTNYDKYEKIVISKKYGEPHEFLLFYTGWDPLKYRTDPNLVRFYQSNWYWVDRFDKFYFVNDWDIPKNGQQFTLESGGKFECASCLLITSPGNAPENWKLLKTINFLDSKAAFEIYEH